MKRALVLLAACTAETDPPWRLDHDRIVAVRATPPRIRPGEISRLDALVAHADGPTTVDDVVGASAPFAPGDLFTAVHFFFDHWQVDGPDESRLAVAREELGLPAGAPVPLEVTVEVRGPLLATKIVWLGDTHANPTSSPVALPDPIPLETEVPLAIAAGGTDRVRWLTSCGTLRDDDQPGASLTVDDPCTGELVVVVRDELGGVDWQILPVRAQ